MSRKGLTKTPAPANVESMSAQDLVGKKDSDSLEIGERRWVVYDYKKNRKGFSLSMREKIIADTWLETQSILACCKEIDRQFPAYHGRYSGDAFVKSILKKPRIAEYVADELIARGKVNWYTKEKWLADGVDMSHKGRGNAVKIAAWKAYGDARWPNFQSPLIQLNQQIQFVQEDGTP